MLTSRIFNGSNFIWIGLLTGAFLDAGIATSTLAQETAGASRPPAHAVDEDLVEADPKQAAAREAELLSQVRQLTFEGRRAGEGYFSKDGTQMVFQSEREPGNPFFQIYLMDLEFGDLTRVSPGTGKTTCAWIHPEGDRVLFASTHGDPASKQLQQAEIDFRESGQERRYSWDYDPQFELYEFDVESKSYKNLTNTRGYDAEGSWSPDGSLICFASNRQAYSRELTEREKNLFELDPASMMDLYIMNADGSNVRQLTDTLGYDGGPFFSPDGQRICWRRFSENGAQAEIMSMKIDGTDVKRLTSLGAMSWAPYYHPSGKYLIFATNRHGFANFELYLVDADARHEPVRVTYTKGFDGLPVFTPDGNQLAWTTNRTSSKQSQIFIGNWDHERALELLGLNGAEEELTEATVAAAESSKTTTTDFAPEDIMRHVDYLCRPELAGRITGSRGERLATAYVAAYLDNLGLVPAGDSGTYFQQFQFTSGVALGEGNLLVAGEQSYAVDKDWRPVAFSKTGPVHPTEITFAGYGIVAPQDGEQEEYDSYVHLDVKGKWVLVLREMPEAIPAERRQHLSRYSSLRYKAMAARDREAAGIIFVSGPNSRFRNELIELGFDGSMAGSSIPVISVSRQVASVWFKETGKSIQSLQDKLDIGDMVMGFDLPKVQLGAKIELEKVQQLGRNVLGRLQAGTEPADQVIVVGAHIDHLGQGPNSSSLARDEERNGIHFGADDNASGVAAMLEVAEYLASLKKAGKLKMKRDIVFAAWSGEELGLLGSSHFVNHYGQTEGTASAAHAPLHPTPQSKKSVYPAIAACLNMDMVGRMKDNLVLQGIGSSTIWKAEIERRNVPIGLSIVLQNDSYLPTDASSFYVGGVPILSAFTGSHQDYHTPRDTPDKLNYEGASKISRFMALVARSLVVRDDAPDYVEQEAPKQQGRARLRAYMGTIPDYAEGITGVKLSGVSKNGPADKGGIKAGDVITRLAGKKIDNIYDYTFAIEALKIGETIEVVVMRDGKELKLQVTPESRD